MLCSFSPGARHEPEGGMCPAFSVFANEVTKSCLESYRGQQFQLKLPKNNWAAGKDSSDKPPLIADYFGIFDDAYEETIKISDAIPWHYTNRIYLAFATLDDQGNLSNFDSQFEERIKKITAIFRKAHPTGEIFISSNYDGDMDSRYLRAAKNPEKFAKGVLSYLQKHDLDGYDMDWESENMNNYSDALKSLLRACHDLFQTVEVNPRGNKYQVTHAVWPGVHSSEIVANLASVVDEINIMSYGPGSYENLINQYHEKGFPYHKMVMGVLSELNTDGLKADILKKIEIVKKYHLRGIYSWRLDNDLRAFNKDSHSYYGPSTFRVAKLVYEGMKQKHSECERD